MGVELSKEFYKILDYEYELENREIIELDHLKLEELKYFAKKNRIQGITSMRKHELIEALRDKGVKITKNDLGDCRADIYAKRHKLKCKFNW